MITIINCSSILSILLTFLTNFSVKEQNDLKLWFESLVVEKDPCENKEFSIFHIDECDYEGQKTNRGTKATYIVVCHVKNNKGPGRAVLTSFYDDENGGKIQFNIFGKRI